MTIVSNLLQRICLSHSLHTTSIMIHKFANHIKSSTNHWSLKLALVSFSSSSKIAWQTMLIYNKGKDMDVA